LNIVEPKKKEVIKMKLRIMNETGHTDLDVNTSEMIEQLAEHPTHWVYVDGDMVSRESVSDINWDGVESVNLVQAIVGGNQ
jgi:sulfur carrier protein ThiS